MLDIPHPKFHELQLQDLILWVHLGCTAEERAKAQEVRVSTHFRFKEIPPGAVSDNLTETICYAEVADALQKNCENKEYHLIERVGLDAYQVCKKIAQGKAELLISVHKVHPPIAQLSGGSHYHCGDFVE